MTPLTPPHRYLLVVTEPEVEGARLFLAHALTPPVPAHLKDHQDAAVSLFAKLNHLVEQQEGGS